MKTNLYVICISIFLGISFFLAGSALCKDPGKGENVYRSNCTVCHLIRSEDPPISAYYREHQPKDFTTASALRNLSEKKIKSVLTQGQGAMRPIKLSADDYKALVDYLINDLKKQSK